MTLYCRHCIGYDKKNYSTGDKMFPKGRKAVKVMYKSGYASTPSDLKLACFDLVKYYLKDEEKKD